MKDLLLPGVGKKHLCREPYPKNSFIDLHLAELVDEQALYEAFSVGRRPNGIVLACGTGLNTVDTNGEGVARGTLSYGHAEGAEIILFHGWKIGGLKTCGEAPHREGSGTQIVNQRLKGADQEELESAKGPSSP